MKKLFKVLITICLVLVMFGCSKTPSPTKVVDEYLKGYLNDPLNTLSKDSFDLSDANETEKEMFNKINELLMRQTYKLDNEKINGDSATVDAHFKVYDFKSIIQSAFSTYIAKALSLALSDGLDEEYEKLFAQSMIDSINEAGADEPGQDFSYTIHLAKENGQWVLDDIGNELEFVDGMLGGLVSAFNELGSSY